MGFLSGRNKTTRSPASSSLRGSNRTKKAESVDEAEGVRKPSLDELRQRRAEYYNTHSVERRRRVGSSTAALKLGQQPSESAVKDKTTTGRRRKRGHRSDSNRASVRAIEGHSDTDAYVYSRERPTRPTLTDDAAARYHSPPDSHHTSSKHPRDAKSSRSSTLSTVHETELRPEDSISQIGTSLSSNSSKRKAQARPVLRRSTTTSSKLRAISEISTLDTPIERSNKRLSERSSPSVRRHSTTSVPSLPRFVECLTCGSDDVPSVKSAKLACGHRMCHDCLKRIFEMSVKDPAHMPPRCCQEQHIPLKHVDKLFDVRFKLLWNRKYQESHTKNRIYCPTQKCGEWIKPSHVHIIQGKRYALCPRCKTKVCTECNTKMHKSSDCPKDPEIAKLVAQAKEEGWQRCFSCRALVEKREGCNHMTCRCTAEFCIVCAAPWKTCQCPLFSYNTTMDGDQLNEMRIPEPIHVVFRQVLRGAADLAANSAPRNRRAGGEPMTARTYQQEVEQRQRQEQGDADLARRLQLVDLVGGNDDDRGANRRGEVRDWGFGNLTQHLMNDDFVQNAANVVMSAFGDADLGRRGERASGRRRRARQTAQDEGEDVGLAPNFLGDESVLGAVPGTRAARAAG